MAKGGYIVIDLKNKPFTVGGSAVKIDGIYNRLEGNYRKPTLVSNIVIGGVERTDRYVNFGLSGSNYVGTLALSDNVDVLQITVTDADMVTIAEY